MLRYSVVIKVTQFIYYKSEGGKRVLTVLLHFNHFMSLKDVFKDKRSVHAISLLNTLSTHLVSFPTFTIKRWNPVTTQTVCHTDFPSPWRIRLNSKLQVWKSKPMWGKLWAGGNVLTFSAALFKAQAFVVFTHWSNLLICVWGVGGVWSCCNICSLLTNIMSCCVICNSTRSKNLDHSFLMTFLVYRSLRQCSEDDCYSLQKSKISDPRWYYFPSSLWCKRSELF